MTQAYEIANPSVSLYPFQLKDNIEMGPDTPDPNAEKIWENLAEIGNILEISIVKNRDYQIDGIEKPLQGKNGLKASILADKIGDMYVADLSLSLNKTIPVNQLANLNPDGCLLPEKFNPSLGQTIIIFAKPVNINNDDKYRTIADDCVKSFVGSNSSQPKFIREGVFLNSPIFEYDSDREIPANQRCHIIVWLYKKADQPENDTLKKLTGDMQFLLRNLLASRSKILFVYDQSRECYKKAQKIAYKLEQKGKEFSDIDQESDREKKLTKLKELLASIRANLLEYAKLIRYIKENHNTIITNTENYENAWDKITANLSPGDTPDFWQKFLDIANNKYSKQITIDLGYLIPSQDLFQQMINIIRGMLEIEQLEFDRTAENDEKERDQYIQNTVFFWGTAVGFGGICASSYGLIYNSEIKEQIKLTFDPSLPLHPFAQSVIISSLLGIAVGLLVLAVKERKKLCKRLKK
jgi:type II secretory pathway pseudopilin PulG